MAIGPVKLNKGAIFAPYITEDLTVTTLHNEQFVAFGIIKVTQVHRCAIYLLRECDSTCISDAKKFINFFINGKIILMNRKDRLFVKGSQERHLPAHSIIRYLPPSSLRDETLCTFGLPQPTYTLLTRSSAIPINFSDTLSLEIPGELYSHVMCAGPIPKEPLSSYAKRFGEEKKRK